MLKAKMTKRLWFRPVLIMVIFIGLIVLVGQVIIFSHSKPLRLYLEFLSRNSQRGQAVAVYSKEDFAHRYLGASGHEIYLPDDFLKLFQEYYNYPPVKKNNLFMVYKIPDKKNLCQINIFGISEKKDLVYVSSQDACLKND
ncbi:MAG: hypothetical protein NTX66_01035 [Candidatus Falkowbacteria bacterium]|nr:hypothetical protein [Candidatus Falkowbacteria bacterium]